jgi:hypothetical protein
MRSPEAHLARAATWHELDDGAVRAHGREGLAARQLEVLRRQRDELAVILQGPVDVAAVLSGRYRGPSNLPPDEGR